MPPLFDLVERELDAHTHLLAPRGELDVATNPAFKAALQLHVADDERVVVDLSEVSFLSAGAMGILARASARMGGRLIVVCPHQRLYRLFEIAGLAGTLNIVASREALAA